MQEFVFMRGIVIKAEAFQEYDRRVVLLTREAGKITAFARGARRSSSKLLAATDQFCFGVFKLLPGKNAYTLVDVEVKCYFDELRTDFDAICYGTFFLEYADYYSAENIESEELLNLLYVSLKAISNPKFPKNLVRDVFEIRAMKINGEFPGCPDGCLKDTGFTVDYITNSAIEKLYTFLVSEEVLKELNQMVEHYRNRYVGHHFKSLDILKTL